MSGGKIDWWVVALAVLGLILFLVLFSALLEPQPTPKATPAPSHYTSLSPSPFRAGSAQFL